MGVKAQHKKKLVGGRCTHGEMCSNAKHVHCPLGQSTVSITTESWKKQPHFFLVLHTLCNGEDNVNRIRRKKTKQHKKTRTV